VVRTVVEAKSLQFRERLEVPFGEVRTGLGIEVIE